MGLRDLFFPKKRDFYKMMLDHARKTEEGMIALNLFVQDPTPEKGQRVEQLEEEADTLRKFLVDELNQSFVTPIDREDIFSISRSIDDMIDYAKTTVEEVRLFKITPNQYLLKMTDALSHAARDLCEGIESLRDGKFEDAHAHATRAKKAENFVEHRYREALAELFDSADVIQCLKYREVYRHLSNAADQGDQAADILSDIVVKVS